MKRTAHAIGIIVTLMLASCDSDGASSTTVESSPMDEPASATAANDPLEGVWHTTITCREMVAALERGGVSTSAVGIVQDEYGLDQRPHQSDPCAGVDGTADHTLRFEGGHFALFAGDELGLEASYELIDEDTFVTGPPEVFTVGFHIEGDALSMRIVEPLRQGPYIATWESAPWERE